jgi:predicted O-methyltransferase YrrM
MSSQNATNMPPHIRTLLDRLHKVSAEQEMGIPKQRLTGVREKFDTEPDAAIKDMDAMMLDKFIALEQDKCLFVYNLLLATGATTVVEAGTSFGVSTIYLALAVAENARRAGTAGIVIGTEKEESKAAIARKHWKEAGLEVEQVIDLRVGDLHDTLTGDLGLGERKVDFLLLDSKFPLACAL